MSKRSRGAAATPAVVALALTFPVVYVSGGRRGFDVGLAAADLVRLTNASTAAIAAV